MKSNRSIFMCVLTGIMTISGCLTASAENVKDAKKLKSGLLLNENMNFNIYDYNTNNDNTVNVLDLCRAKRKILADKPAVGTQIRLELGNEQISHNDTYITVPVRINNNQTGITSAEFRINYNKQYFSFKNVRTGDFSNSNSWITGEDSIYFMAGYGQNINDDGNIVYLEFEVSSYVPFGYYEFSLCDIKGYVFENWSQKKLSSDECAENSSAKYILFERNEITATTPITTVTTTAAPPETTVTTTVTPQVTTTEPVTTVTTTATEITTVTTTVTTPETTVTTVTEPPVMETTTVTTTVPSYDDEISQIEREVLNEIIAWRRELGLSELQVNNALCRCAGIRAQDLSVSYGEYRPDGTALTDFLSENHVPGSYYNCEYRNKNINSSSKLMSVFKKLISMNPGYATEDPSYSYVGVGYYNGYWSVIFTG